MELSVGQGVVFTLNGLGNNGQRQGLSDVVVVHFLAYDLNVAENGRRGCLRLDDAVVVIPAVVKLPVLLIDVEFEAVFRGEFLRIHTIHDLCAQIKWMIAIALDAHLFADNIPGHDIHALFREGLADFIATDTHAFAGRGTCMTEGMAALRQKYGEAAEAAIRKNIADILVDILPEKC